jgi:hypothetical protein
MANCSPGPNLRRLLVGLHVEGEPFGWPLRGVIWFTVAIIGSCYCHSCRIRSEIQIVGEGHAPCGSISAVLFCTLKVDVISSLRLWVRKLIKVAEIGSERSKPTELDVPQIHVVGSRPTEEGIARRDKPQLRRLMRTNR